ncbi:GntR family transcriptional regulator [Glycomyces sp. YM15]|uniref:GntR family transcriptional regulator n=1 Tax=Glycomyces sp. YM15 TaxID=2800446 RepID=UPI001963A1FB|nr:GntR family transcriptional regulator [Glycomyces sp. YM15]
MAPNLERAKPAYQQIYEHLRGQIVDGTIADGARLPSVRELAADWGTHTSTVQKALAALHREGLTESEHGKGTFARPHKPHRTAQDRLRTTRATGRIYPKSEYARIVEAELTTAAEPIASGLGVEPGAAVIRRLRVTLNKDTEQPVSVSTSWFAGELATACPALLETERLPEGTPAYIERTTGRRITAGREQHTADAATERDAELLGVDPGAPVQRGRNWMFDADGDVIEYGESVSAALRWSTYSYDIQPATES